MEAGGVDHRFSRDIKLPSPDVATEYVRRYRGTHLEGHATLLLQLARDRFSSIATLVETSGKSERTVFRCLHVLRTQGVDAYFGKKTRGRLSQRDRERLKAAIRKGDIATIGGARKWVEKHLDITYSPAGFHDMVERELSVTRRLDLRQDSKNVISGGSSMYLTANTLLDFLNAQPRARSLKTWVREFRQALRIVFPTALRIGLDVVFTDPGEEGEVSRDKLRHLEIEQVFEGGSESSSTLLEISEDQEQNALTHGEEFLEIMQSTGAYSPDLHEALIRTVVVENDRDIGYLVLTYTRGTGDREKEERVLNLIAPYITQRIADAITICNVFNPDRIDQHQRIQAVSEKIGLTPTQHKVFVLLMYGASYQDVAESLSITQSTVGKHVVAIRKNAKIGPSDKLSSLLIDPDSVQQ